jgi:hypothetical protein
MLRWLLPPVVEVGFGEGDEVSPGHLAPVEIGTMLVEVARPVKEPATRAVERERPSRPGVSEPPGAHLPR